MASVTTAPVGKRKALSLATGEAILDSAVAVFRSHGPDSLNLSQVARSAGVTTGAVYARYENREELLVDVWVRRAGPQLRTLLDLTVRAYTGDDKAAAQAAAMLDSRDGCLTAGYLLMVMAPRVDELGEVVLPDMRDWFADSPTWSDALIAIAYVLGAVGFDSVLDAPDRDWGAPLAWAGALGAPDRHPRGKAADERQDALAELIHAETGDPVRDAMLVSMASVVARSGLARATTARVARTAGFPQSALFALWPTRADLVAEWAPTVLEGLVRSAAAAGWVAASGDATEAAQGLSEILGPSYHLARRMRLELLLAAVTDPVVAAAVASSDETSVARLIEQDPGQRVLADALRAVVLGFVLLEETIGGMADLDLVRPIAPLLQAARAQ